VVAVFAAEILIVIGAQGTAAVCQTHIRGMRVIGFAISLPVYFDLVVLQGSEWSNHGFVLSG
jgi:hypothetical protein